MDGINAHILDRSVGRRAANSERPKFFSIYTCCLLSAQYVTMNTLRGTSQDNTETAMADTPKGSPLASAGLAGHGEQSDSPLEKVKSAEPDYPTGIKLALVLASIYFSVFLVAIDRTIIATAIPRITDDFHSFDDIGWVGFPPFMFTFD